VTVVKPGSTTARRRTTASKVARLHRSAGGRPARPAALLCRRATFDAVVRRRAVVEPGLTTVTGVVDGLHHYRGRVRGVTMAGRILEAELVVDASGRASRFADQVRAPWEGGDCGAVYVDRQYRFHDHFDGGAVPAPTNSAIGLSLSLTGYVAIAFLHDDRTFSVTFVHDGSDRRLRSLRHDAVFEAAVRAIPGLSVWTDPGLARPIANVLPGGKLYNGYRRQHDGAGRPMAPGLISLGDAVCTTTPLAGRGVTLALAQARALLRSLDVCGDDVDTASARFEQWCTDNVRPWFEDHRHADADRMRRWSGGDVDVTRRLPSDLVVAAAATDDALRVTVEPYARMDALPESLDAVEPFAREIFAGGWRPAVPDGPTRAELAELCVTHGLSVA
jgi:2-polyprenyl-6-methoxyphenol hydroxylase-like FAD-dependent oxidoreductase